MTLQSRSIPSLLNGVSQQAPTLRRSSQLEEQINCISEPVEGLGKRPASRHAAKLSSNNPTQVFRHTINRDPRERYAVYIEDGSLMVYDLVDDEFRTVNAPQGLSYLNDPEGFGYSAVTAKDFTFICNRGVTVEMFPDVTPTRNPEALVSVKGGSFGKTYKILIDGIERGAFTVPDGSLAAHEVEADTVFIADQLVTAVNENVNGDTPTVIATRYGSDIHLFTPGGEDFTINVEDGFAGLNMTSTKEVTQKFSDLPTEGPYGVIIKVLGDQEQDTDDYYVEFSSDDGGTGTGTWKETIAPGLQFKLDPLTMPHVLRREEDDTFTFEPAIWDDRQVGDDDSAPVPTFVGQRINHVFYHRNRFGVLAGENAITSRGAGEHFNFFRSTVIVLPDTDPIDVAAVGDNVAVLLDTILYNEDLIIRSSNGQYVFSGEPLLTPKNISLDRVANYETSPIAKPVVVGNKAVGDRVYYPFTRGVSSGVWEMSVIDEPKRIAADDLNEHVPTYIPGEFIKLAGSSMEKMIAGVTDESRNRVWIYRFLWSGRGEKLQSSWSQWTFGDESNFIFDVAFIESQLLVTYAAPDGVYLDIVDVSPGQRDTGYDYAFLMDRRVTEAETSPVFDGTHTTWTLPYSTDRPLWVAFRSPFGPIKRGMVITHTRPSSTTIQTVGDFTAAEVFIGEKYSAMFELSEIFLRQQGPTGSTVTVSEGRTQISTVTFIFARSGYFEVHVTPFKRDTRIKKFTGKTLGEDSATIGDLNPQKTGKFKSRINSRNTQVQIKVVSDSFLPFFVTGAEWEGVHSLRSRR